MKGGIPIYFVHRIEMSKNRFASLYYDDEMEDSPLHLPTPTPTPVVTMPAPATTPAVPDIPPARPPSARPRPLPRQTPARYSFVDDPPIAAVQSQPPMSEREFPALSSFRRPTTPPFPPQEYIRPTLADRIRSTLQKEETDRSVRVFDTGRRSIEMSSVIPTFSRFSTALRLPRHEQLNEEISEEEEYEWQTSPELVRK